MSCAVSQLEFPNTYKYKKPCAHGDVAYKEGQLKHAYESGISYWYQTENCFKFIFFHMAIVG